MVWGAAAWRFLHCVTLTYPQRPSWRARQDMKDFLHSLGPILPCRLCRTHYQSFLRQHPVDSALKNRVTLVQWMMDLHNEVNRRLDKPEMSYHDALLQMRSACSAAVKA